MNLVELFSCEQKRYWTLLAEDNFLLLLIEVRRPCVEESWVSMSSRPSSCVKLLDLVWKYNKIITHIIISFIFVIEGCIYIWIFDILLTDITRIPFTVFKLYKNIDSSTFHYILRERKRILSRKMNNLIWTFFSLFDIK